MSENSFKDAVNNAIESFSNIYGAGDIINWIQRNIFKKVPVDAIGLQNAINVTIAKNKTNGQKVLDEIGNHLNRLRQIVPSIATKDILEQAISKAKIKYNNVNRQLNLAEAYENAANNLSSQISYMTEGQRMSDRAKSLEKDAKDKLNQAEHIYDNLASDYEKQNEIGG